VPGIQPNGISSFQVPATGKFLIHVKKMLKVGRKIISLAVLLMRRVGNTNHSHNFDMKYERDLKRILHITFLSSIRPKADSITGNLKAFQKNLLRHVAESLRRQVRKMYLDLE
jgi:hypothetical protein